jgi:hypothetical protein
MSTSRNIVHFDQLPLSVFETEVNLVPIDVFNDVTAVTRAALMSASMRQYSTIVAASSEAMRRSMSFLIMPAPLNVFLKFQVYPE